MSTGMKLSLFDHVVVALENTFELAGEMLMDLVRRAYHYAKAYAVTVTFAVLYELAEGLAKAKA